MKSKKLLPQFITAAISIIMLMVSLFHYKVNVGTYPFYFYEKMGIYFGDVGYGVTDKTFSFNGFYEFFVSILKSLSTNSAFSYIIPVTIFSITFVLALVIISNAVSLTRYQWTAYFASVLVPIIFADFVNLAYFKTLYIYPIILILLLLICGIFITMFKNEKISIVKLILVTILAILYSMTGTVQAITTIVIGILIALLFKYTDCKKIKITSVILGCIVVVQSLLFTFNYNAYDYKQTLYNSVFHGVCKYDSVTALGLDKELDDFKEIYYGMMENEEDYDLENNFYNKVSYSKLIKYYITHPVNTFKIINNQAKAAFYNEYDYGFTPYSSLKKKFIPMSLPIAIGITVIYIIIASVIGKKYENLKPTTTFLSGIAVMWFVSLMATALYYGNSDITQNMFTFNILFDILFAGALIGGLRIVIQGQDEKKEKFGITNE